MTRQGKMCLLSAFTFGVQVGIRGNPKTFLWTKKKKTFLRMKFPQRKPFLSHRFHILCLHLLLISVKIDYKLKECIKGTLTVGFFSQPGRGIPPGKWLKLRLKFISFLLHILMVNFMSQKLLHAVKKRNLLHFELPGVIPRGTHNFPNSLALPSLKYQISRLD